MAGEIRIVRRVRVGSKRVFATVVSKAGRLDLTRVTYKGKTFAPTSGTFHLDYAEKVDGKYCRRRPAIGDDAAAAKRALATQAHVLELRRRGIDVDDAPELQSTSRIEGITLAKLQTAFEESPPVRLGRKSFAKYRNAIASFVEWAATVQITHASQVDAKQMEQWMRYMRDVERLDSSTIVDKVVIAAPELRRHGAKIELRPQDLPKVTEREVEIYTPQTLQALFALCNEREYVTYQTLLLTGVREQEAAYLGWEDIDAKRSAVRIVRKADLGFEIKNYQERTIPVPRRLVELLMKHKQGSRPEARLVFETTDVWKARGVRGGQRDKKLLIKLKKIALRGGLNCGRCSGTWNNKPVTCVTHPVCGKFTLHRFRHTYATNMLRDKVDIVSVSKLLGHKDVATTRRYLRALESDQLQEAVETSTLSQMFINRPLDAADPRLVTPSVPVRKIAHRLPAVPLPLPAIVPVAGRSAAQTQASL